MGQIEHPGSDPARLRVSDADRERVAEVLRTAAGEGRIDFDELEERLEATYAARTYADLVPITVDLPTQTGGLPVHRPTPQVPGTATHESSWALMSETKRQGAWLVPTQHTAVAIMGSVVIDLREATFSGQETKIVANAVMGSVEIYVDAHTHVIMDGTPIMGEFSMSTDKEKSLVDPNSPVVRVVGVALMGSVTAQRRPPRGTPKKFLGTY